MSQAAVRSFFDENVHEWDAVRYTDETYIGRARVALRWIKRMPRGRRVLDLGCGAGHQAAAMVSMGHNVVAADFSYEMARATREKLKLQHAGRPACVVVADALHPPFKNDSFDVVLALGVVGFVSDRPAFFRNAHELIARAGQLICDAGVPEQSVLLQRASARITRTIRKMFRMPEYRRPTGWYSAHFTKQAPEEFENALRAARFRPEARGGGGFGELLYMDTPLLPWRVHTWLSRMLSSVSTWGFGVPLARRALTYVVCSVRES